MIGRLFGLAERDLPPTIDDLDAYRARCLTAGTVRHRLGSPARHTDRARATGALDRATAGGDRQLHHHRLLPDQIRRLYGFSAVPPPMVRKALVAGGAEYVKRVVLPFLPERLRLVPHARAA